MAKENELQIDLYEGDKLIDILEKRNLEQYVLDDNPIVAYFGTAFAGHDLLYKLIQIGSLKQKINVIEHGSSKHVKILCDDYSLIIRKRALKKISELEKNIFHEYVTSEKLEIILNPYSNPDQLEYFIRETNLFVEVAYINMAEKYDLYCFMADEEFNKNILKTISLTDKEKRKLTGVDLSRDALNLLIEKDIKSAKKFISKYNFTFKIEHCYQVGYLIISKDSENLLNLPVNYSYHNEDNPLIFIFVRDAILETIRDALDVYNTSLDQCDFSSIESFQEYSDKRLFIKKIGFTKEELSKILEENSKYQKGVANEQ